MSFKEYAVGFVLIGVFTLALLVFGIQIANENDAQQNINQDPRIATLYYSINSSLGLAYNYANDSKASFEQDNGFLSFGSLVFNSIVGVGITITKIPILIYDAVMLFLSDVLGIPPIIINSGLAIILITIVLLLWRVYRIGS